MANRVDPDETAHYEPSHLDLHCLQKYLPWSTDERAKINIATDKALFSSEKC